MQLLQLLPRLPRHADDGLLPSEDNPKDTPKILRRYWCPPKILTELAPKTNWPSRPLKDTPKILRRYSEDTPKILKFVGSTPMLLVLRSFVLVSLLCMLQLPGEFSSDEENGLAATCLGPGTLSAACIPPSSLLQLACESADEDEEGASNARSIVVRRPDPVFPVVPAAANQQRSAALAASSRGRYLRKTEEGDKGLRSKWWPYVRAHLTAISQPFSWFAQPHQCHPKCQYGLNCVQRVRPDDLKHCAAYSFGTTNAALEQREADRQLIKNHTAGDNWFTLLHSLRTVNAEGSVTHLDFKIVHGSGVSICGPVMGEVYGAPKSTWKAITSAILAGQHHWRDQLASQIRQVTKNEDTKVFQSFSWWLDRVRTYANKAHPPTPTPNPPIFPCMCVQVQHQLCGANDICVRRLRNESSVFDALQGRND